MLDARRRACLQAMGIEVWRCKDRVAVAGVAQSGAGESGTGHEPRQAPSEKSAASHSEPNSAARPVPDAQPPARDPRTSMSPPGDDTAASAQGLDPAPAALQSAATLGWDELQSTVAACKACALHEKRTQTVFGVGDQQAQLMVIGEAPGADEDRQGEPFVGRAGQLLNAMLAAIGFERGQVYIANIVKCRPPGNRDPHAEEAAACRDFLARQIELIAPKLILSVGRVSAHNLLGTDEAVGRLRGTVHRLDPGNVPLIVTYHPAYLLRRPQEKAKSWQDLQAAWRLLNDA
jgi:DNA polymerase